MSKEAQAPYMTNEEQDEIFDDPIADAMTGKPTVAEQNAAAAAKAPAKKPTAAAEAPAEEEVAAEEEEQADGDGAEEAEEGEESAAPEEAALPPLSAAEVEARVWKEVADKVLSGQRGSAAASTAAPTEPKHVAETRRVVNMSEKEYEAEYDRLLDAKDFRGAEALASRRTTGQIALDTYDLQRQILATQQRQQQQMGEREAEAVFSSMRSKFGAEPVNRLKDTMIALAEADNLRIKAGKKPLYDNEDSLFHAAQGLVYRGKTPPLAPGVKAAKTALTSGAPAQRTPTGQFAKKPAKKAGFVDDVFADNEEKLW